MEQKYEYNLTIIIPHFNTPDLLENLLITIPERDDIQVIVVDDRSTDKLEELDTLKVKYANRVAFYRNDRENKGAGACRNIGIEHAEGKWLLFSDADDYFLENMYEIVSAYFESEFDEIFFTPTSIYLDTGELSNRHVMFERRIRDYQANPSRKNLLKLKISLSSPCSKMIRHELIQKYQIRCDEVLFFNDMMFSVKVGHYSQKITTTDQKIYCIVRYKGSMTTQTNWDAYHVRLMEYLDVCDFIKQHYSRRDMKMMHYTCLGMLYRAISAHYGMKRYCEVVHEFVKRRLPLFSIHQVGLDVFAEMLKDLRAKKVDSNYLVSDRENGDK